MTVEQITIFLENESGRLAEVATLLGEAGVNIRALTLADSADFGFLRLIVDDTRKAKDVLNDAGFTVDRTEVVGIAIPDRPGGLAEILNTVKAHRVNVEYMYAFVQKSSINAVVIFRFDDLPRAVECLRMAGIRILTGEEIYSL
jgi:hypothetical protein